MVADISVASTIRSENHEQGPRREEGNQEKAGEDADGKTGREEGQEGGKIAPGHISFPRLNAENFAVPFPRKRVRIVNTSPYIYLYGCARQLGKLLM